MKEDQKQKLLSCNVLTNLELIISLLEINLMMKLAEKYPFLQKEKECLALSLLQMENKEFMSKELPKWSSRLAPDSIIKIINK
jgi:hypothetical protein